MCLGSEVDDRIDRADLAHVLACRDVTPAAVDPFGQVGRIPGIRELVQDHHVLAGREHPLDEMRADEPRTTGYQ